MAATRGLSLFVGRDAQRAELESALEHALVGLDPAFAEDLPLLFDFSECRIANDRSGR